MESFQDYAYYYNLFYGDKDYAEEALVINDFIEKYTRSKAKREILNIGCGTGRHDIELHKLGYKVHGIDLSAVMIQIAKDNVTDIDGFLYEVQDARSFTVMKQYDIVVSLFHVMSYQNTNEDVSKVFECVSKALNRGGVFIFDAWYGPGVLSDKPSVRVKRVEDEENQFVRIAEPILYPNENIVGVQYNINIINKLHANVKQINEVHNMRYFFKPEIEELLKHNGLRLVDCLDCYTLQTPDFNSWTVYFIVEKMI